MPKLTLIIDGRQVGEHPIGRDPVTIGRLPDNLIVFDNPAVSAHHACVRRDGDHYVVEDLKSTNGTFVNDRPIVRHTLRDRDVVHVGRHVLVFSQLGGDHAVRPGAGPSPRPTGGAAEIDTLPLPPTSLPVAPARLGSLRVVAGESAADEYTLTGVTSLIGKDDSAQIKLKGWFKPKIAAALSRTAEGYAVSPVGATTWVNARPITTRQDLSDGDVIEVSGLKLEFRFKPAG